MTGRRGGRGRTSAVWDEGKRRGMLEEIAAGGSLEETAKQFGTTKSMLFRARRELPGFDADVKAAIEAGRAARAELLEDRLLKWAADGVPRPLVFRGEVTDPDHREIDAALSWRVLQSLRRDVYGNHVNVSVQHELTVFVDPLERRARLLELERQHPELAERAGVLPVLTLDDEDVVEEFEVAR